jgi:Glycosyltransferase family 9 (heptosyltransferase)
VVRNRPRRGAPAQDLATAIVCPDGCRVFGSRLGRRAARVSQGTAFERSFLAVHSRSVVNLVGDTSIEELAAALDRCAVYVGNDSGPKHIAAALGKPVIEVSWINCDDKILRFDRNFAAFGTRNVIIRPPRPFTPQATFAGQAVQSVPVEVVIREVEALLSRGLV